MLFNNDLNLNQDPLFTDINNFNYRLSTGSPAIDAGENNDAPLFDKNRTRPLDGNIDSILDTTKLWEIMGTRYLIRIMGTRIMGTRYLIQFVLNN